MPGRSARRWVPDVFPEPPRQRWLWVFVIVPVALLPAAFQRGGGDSDPPPRRHEITIQTMAFQPAQLEVAIGDTIVWVNRDIVPHNATATGATPAWQTTTLVAGESGIVVVRQAGEMRYLCTLHPTMQARLIVR